MVHCHLPPLSGKTLGVDTVMKTLLPILICQVLVLGHSMAQVQSDSIEICHECVYLHEFNDILTVTDNLRLPKIESEKVSDCQTCRYGILIDVTTGLSQSVTIENSCGNDIDSLAIMALQVVKYQVLPQNNPQVTKYYVSLPFYFKSGVMSSLLHDMMSGENRFCKKTTTKLARIAQGRQGEGFLDVPFGEPPKPISGLNAIKQQLSHVESFKKKGIERLFLQIFVDNNGRIGPYTLVGAQVNGKRVVYESKDPTLQELADIAFSAVRSATKWKPGTIWDVPCAMWFAIPVNTQ